MRILIITCASSEIDIGSGNNENYPRLAEISWIVVDEKFKVLKLEKSHYIYPDDDFKRVSPKAKAINGLNVEILREKGEKLKSVLDKLYKDAIQANYIVGANLWFVKKILMWEFEKNNPGTNFNTLIAATPQIDILDVARPLVKAKYSDLKSGIKRPSLKETVKKLTNEDIKENTYNSDTIIYVFKCFAILCKIGMISFENK